MEYHYILKGFWYSQSAVQGQKSIRPHVMENSVCAARCDSEPASIDQNNRRGRGQSDHVKGKNYG